MLNRELMLKTRQLIIDHNEQFNYTEWRKGTPKSILLHTCGACACVGGFAEVAYLKENPGKERDATNSRKILGLTDEQAEYLFYCGSLDDEPSIPLLKETSYREAIKRIDYLLMKDGYDISTLPTID